MYNTIFLFLAILLPIGLPAQTIERQLIGSAGGYFVTAAGSLDASLGEIAVRTLYDPLVWGEGFHQTEATVTSAAPAAVTPESLRVWPNPTTGLVNVEAATPVQLAWFDATGRLLGQQATTANRSTLDFSGLPPGIYLVNVRDEDQRSLQTIRLVVH